ncbi:hypothetical protein GGR21_002519 [Dysgonomonas hofstadii]|uniref:Uncharacterized protein n=1 Tax=Dysgonomonas hofstadii TaxID=637886 RepID=A0A840CXJ5_9BACT|nr:hypothetical protein [Dysgonomonas hofstadii]MBB4036613.1 hypothetical protein [Dysgonomonas hofstadii]
MTNEEKDRNQQLFNEFIREFKKIKSNPVYFMEYYYNRLFPDKIVLMDDEDRQELYDHFKGIPFIRDSEDWNKLNKIEERRKEKGLKDWEYED